MNVEAIPMPAAARGEPTLPLEPEAPPEAPRHYQSFADKLLALSRTSSWQREGRRLAVAVGLTALYGAAIGLRRGGMGIAVHALGAPAGILAVTALAVPAFAIVLALANAPVDALSLARATARAAAKGGLLLGGLAPAAALFVVTVEDAITVTLVGFGGLFLAGLVGVSSFSADLAPLLGQGSPGMQRIMAAAMPGFLLFAAALAARVWWLALPLLTGAA